MARPWRAASVLSRDGISWTLLAWVPSAVVWGIAFLLAVAWHSTARWPASPPPATQGSAATSATVSVDVFTLQLGTLADAEENIRLQHGPVAVSIILVMTLLLDGLATASMAFLVWPSAHRVGSAGQAYRRSLTAAVVCAGWRWVVIGVVTIAWMSLQLMQQAGAPPSVFAKMWVWPVLGTAACLSVWSLMGLCGSVARGHRPERARPAWPAPRCEECGYDLTHVPASGVCPECGVPTEASLTPGLTRRPSPWERRPGLGSWLVTTRNVLGARDSFYRDVAVRSRSGPAWSFAAWQFPPLLCASFVWIAALMVSEEPSASLDKWTIPLFMSVLAVVVAWYLHRALAAMTAAWWAREGSLHDFRIASKVFAFETAYIWAYFLFNGLTFTAVVKRWLRPLEGLISGVVAAPPEPILFLFGNLALTVWWLRRYAMIHRAIRWNNY